MAALAKWYQDTNGTLTSGGTPTAYTLTTNNVHTDLADQSLLVFRADQTCGQAPTLAVDGLTPYQIVKEFDRNIGTGDIQANQVVVVVYNSAPATPVYEMISHLGENISPAKAWISYTATTNTVRAQFNKGVDLIHGHHQYSAGAVQHGYPYGHRPGRSDPELHNGLPNRQLLLSCPYQRKQYTRGARWA
jgi:hypothetical protein